MKKLILLSILLIVGCEEITESIIEGCTTITACNYDVEAIKDDGSCVIPQGCNQWCEGGSDTTSVSLELDCKDICGGTAIIDDCGVCTGGTTGLEVDYLKDECGVCGGDNSSCKDCLGIPNGTATMDNCGICDNYTNNDCVNHIEMELEIMPSSIYKVSDWFSGTINLAALSIQNITNETKEISIYYQAIINDARVVEGQTKPISLVSGEVKVISNVNFDPYSIWWYNNELNFINNLMSIGYLLTGNYSIQISANKFDESYSVNEETYDSHSRPYNSNFWSIRTGYISTDTLYYSNSN